MLFYPLVLLVAGLLWLVGLITFSIPVMALAVGLFVWGFWYDMRHPWW